jgi:predicted transcriptional regulator
MSTGSYSWVDKGCQRKAILKVMSEPQTPTQTCKKSKMYNKKISLNNTSDILRSFVKRGLAVCINNDKRRGRLYKLTETGEEVRMEFLKENMPLIETH